MFSKFLEKITFQLMFEIIKWQIPTSGPPANCSKLLVSDKTNCFDQNTCFLKDALVSKQKISHLLDFDQIVYIYIMKIQRTSFLKKFKSVITKLLIKFFSNWEPVNFFKGFHSNLTSIIQLETVFNTSVLDSLQFTFQYLIRIWIPS